VPGGAAVTRPRPRRLPTPTRGTLPVLPSLPGVLRCPGRICSAPFPPFADTTSDKYAADSGRAACSAKAVEGGKMKRFGYSLVLLAAVGWSSARAQEQSPQPGLGVPTIFATSYLIDLRTQKPQGGSVPPAPAAQAPAAQAPVRHQTSCGAAFADGCNSCSTCGRKRILGGHRDFWERLCAWASYCPRHCASCKCVHCCYYNPHPPVWTYTLCPSVCHEGAAPGYPPYCAKRKGCGGCGCGGAVAAAGPAHQEPVHAEPPTALPPTPGPKAPAAGE
jgi:hypothetical protein